MTGLLLKKQLLELKNMYMQPGKKGKVRSKAAVAGLLVVFVLLFLCMSAAFAGISVLFASAFFPAGMSWLYFALTGVTSVFLSSLVNMFVASSQLYSSKDNSLLLPMPVRPSAMAFSRMFVLYLDGLLYESMTFLPSVIVYWIKSGEHGFRAVMCPLVLFLLNSLVILSLSSLLGWVVKQISSRLKNKAFASVLLSVVLISVYYVSYFRMNEILTSAVAHMDAIAAVIRKKLLPVYLMGCGASGNLKALAAWAAVSMVLFALVYAVIARSFLRIITTEYSSAEKKYTGAPARQATSPQALLRKELLHFSSSPAYMLNTGLGYLIMPAAGIYMVIAREKLRGLLSLLPLLSPGSEKCVPGFLLSVVCMISSMCCFTAPSISLEGRSLWLLKSLPVSYGGVLRAKRKAHMLLLTLPVTALCVLSSIAISLPVGVAAIVLVCALLFAWLSGTVGILVNLKYPVFNWTSETQPVKQGAAVAITLFGGWIAALALAALCWFTRRALPMVGSLLVVLMLLVAASVAADLSLRKKGAALFAGL